MADNGRVSEAQKEVERLRRRARRRMQDARDELERFSHKVQEQASSGDLSTDIEAALEDLRAEVEALESTLRQRADSFIHDVEEQAKRVEGEIESGFEEADKAVRRNPWRMIFVALVVGLVIGILLRNSNKN